VAILVVTLASGGYIETVAFALGTGNGYDTAICTNASHAVDALRV
jgi:hypothetical protein